MGTDNLVVLIHTFFEHATRGDRLWTFVFASCNAIVAVELQDDFLSRVQDPFVGVCALLISLSMFYQPCLEFLPQVRCSGRDSSEDLFSFVSLMWHDHR